MILIYFWDDPVREEAMRKIGISLSPLMLPGIQPTTSTMGMSGETYFEDPASSNSLKLQ